MQKLIIVTLVCLFASALSAQNYINATKNKSKRNLAFFSKIKKYHTTLTETDTSISFQLRDPTVQNLDIVLHFDPAGRCDREVTVFYCDSCYRKSINNIAINKQYNWRKLNDKTYISETPYLLLWTPLLNIQYAYLLERSDLTPKEHSRKWNSATGQ